MAQYNTQSKNSIVTFTGANGVEVTVWDITSLGWKISSICTTSSNHLLCNQTQMFTLFSSFT